ncbi:Hint domain-containing protein [Acetobacter pasteurianus]|uniref:Hint domain-containing protein n=1 Tax=Acetobacter pasteurianus TaxID=438 RepID=UPI003D0C4B27
MSTKTVSWTSGGSGSGDYSFGTSEYDTIVSGDLPATEISDLTITGNVTFEGSGVVTIKNNLNVSSNITINNGMSFIVKTNLEGSPNGSITINAGAKLAYEKSDGNTEINFGSLGKGETSTLEVSNTNINNKITNLSPGDNITFSGYSENTNIYFQDTGKKDSDGNEIYQILDGNKDSTPLVSYVTLASGASPSDFYWDSSTDSIVCFLAGTMIRTCAGEVAIENIQIGDEIITFDGRSGGQTVRPVVWVGKAHAIVRPGLPDDEAGYPVCVIKDAIADGVPYKDMLITSEHCLFFEGRFVPVRILVNGSTIFYDKSITSYDYYHVETDQHSVIIADGMLTESYLDTGNRRAFRQKGKVAALRINTKSWEHNAGAPLCVERSFVEPLFHKLKARENTVFGCSVPTEQAELTEDPNLHLVTQAGAVIRPVRQDGQRYSFMLPANTQFVRIVSHASRPADVIGPFVDDRRQMGVAVADMYFTTAQKLHPITAHLQADKPEGWHDTDWTDCAWTNGNAVLPLGDLTKGNMGLLSMTIRAKGPYLRNTQLKSNIRKQSA